LSRGGTLNIQVFSVSIYHIYKLCDTVYWTFTSSTKASIALRDACYSDDATSQCSADTRDEFLSALDSPSATISTRERDDMSLWASN